MKSLWMFLSLLVFTINVQAQSPEELIRQATDTVLADIKINLSAYKKNPDKLYAFVEQTVLKHFDFERMTKLALGRHQRKISDSQMRDMQKEFQQLLVRTYSNALLEYEDQGIIYLSSRGSIAKGDVTVRTEIDQPGGFPIPLSYKLYLKDGAWAVYDISVDSISLVTNYRSSFSRQIKKIGIDGLIKMLQDRNRSA